MKVNVATAIVGILILAPAFSCIDEKFAWRELEFHWPSDDAKNEAVENGNYVVENNLPLAFDVWKDKIFLTVPRWKTGVANTLNYIETSGGEKSPILHPYPNFSMNQLPSSEGENNKQQSSLISAFGVRVDECDRLWVVDCGLTDLLGQTKKFQNPSLFIFNLNNDGELIRRFEIPEGQIKENSFFVSVFVDVPSRSKCDETFAYTVDIYGHGIIVYDYNNNRSWRVNHDYFAFDPIKTDFNVANVNFQFHDGIFGMALGKIHNEHGDRDLYFHAYSSTYEFSVKNDVLKNETFSTNPVASFHSFKFLGNRGSFTQSSAEVYDEKTNAIFYTLPNHNAIGCWNINTEFSVENQGFVAKDNETLIFPNDVRIDSNGNLFILSNRMPLFMFSSLPSGEYNYRIMMGKTSEIIKGTPCE